MKIFTFFYFYGKEGKQMGLIINTIRHFIYGDQRDPNIEICVPYTYYAIKPRIMVNNTNTFF